MVAITSWKGVDEKLGTKEIIITSKNAPNEYPDTESKEGRDVIQARVDALERIYCRRIAEGRKVSVEAIMANLPRHMKAIFAIGYYTGMRRAEILGLTWDKIDKKKRTINLAAADIKDQEPRAIPICEKLWVILKNIPQAIHDTNLFQYRENPLADVRAILRKACKEAGGSMVGSKRAGSSFTTCATSSTPISAKTNA